MADDLLSSELLALAGDDDHIKNSRKRPASGSKGSSSKRRKHEVSDSDGSVESEEEAVEYPLEGKYKDEEDREELMRLPEIKREAIISKRLETIQKENQRRNLERMVKSQAAGAGSGIDSVSKAAKRKHTSVGASQTKSQTLAVLKQKRHAKEHRRVNKGHDSDSPAPRRQRSESPLTSSDDEDGQVSRRQDDASSLDGVQLKADEKLTVKDLQRVQITRDMLENQCMSDKFAEYVTGGWVRVLVGMDQGQTIYRLAEVTGISSELVEPYQLNLKTVNQQIEVKHGALQRAFLMQKVSCGSFTDREFDRLIRQLEVDKIAPPTKGAIDKKAQEILTMDARPRTDAEISAMIDRQKAIRKVESNQELLFRKSGIIGKRKLALQRGDTREVAELTKELETVEEDLKQRVLKSTAPDALSKVNERNRKANLESMRKAELEVIARRKREAAGGATVDLSARVKTVPKTRFDSRAGTPSTPAAATPTLPTAPVTSTTNSSRLKVDDVARSVVIEDLF